MLESGDVITFDYCVVATGSTNRIGSWGQPQGTKIEERKKELVENSEKIKKAQRIVIVGTGATGVELAAEIVDKYAGRVDCAERGDSQSRSLWLGLGPRERKPSLPSQVDRTGWRS